MKKDLSNFLQSIKILDKNSKEFEEWSFRPKINNNRKRRDPREINSVFYNTGVQEHIGRVE